MSGHSLVRTRLRDHPNMITLAKRGLSMTGLDLSTAMLTHAQNRADEEGDDLSLKRAKMRVFRVGGAFDLVFCLISSFNYLATEAHLLRFAARLPPDLLYMLVSRPTDDARDLPEHKRWGETAHDGTKVICNTRTWPAERRLRRECVRNRLVIEKHTREVMHHDYSWHFRTYDATLMRRIVRTVPSLELVACYDFQHDIRYPRHLDDSQENLVLVLRKRP